MIIIKILTSSTLSPISSVALQIAFVVPVMVTIRSGVEPSEIKTLAPDYKNNKLYNNINKLNFNYLPGLLYFLQFHLLYQSHFQLPKVK